MIDKNAPEETDEIDATPAVKPADNSADLDFKDHMQGRVVLTRLRAAELAARYKKDNAAEVLAIRSRIARVSDKIRAVENGLPTVHAVDHTAFVGVRIQGKTDLSQDREIELGAALSAKESQSHLRATYTSRAGTDPIIADVVKAPAMQSCLARLTDAQLDHQIEAIPSYGFLNRSSRISEIKTTTSSPTIDMATRLSLCREAQDLSSPHAAEMCAAETERINAIYRATIAPLEKELLNTALAELSTRKTDAVESEKAFFKSHGVEWKPTHVSTRFDAVIKQVQTRLNPPPRHPAPASQPTARDARNTVAEYFFGVSFCPLAIAAIPA